MTRQDVHDELRARLHEAAEAHEPDRARILARVERGMAAPPPRPGHGATRPPVLGWVRVVGATAAVAGVLAIGGYAVASAVRGDQPAQQTVAVSPTPASSPAATTPPSAHTAAPAPTTGATHPSRTPSSPPAGAPQSSARPPVAHGDQDGPLWSDGSVDPHSNDFWAQSDLTLKTSTRLTALTVQLKVAQTGGVAMAGAWRSLPETDFTQTAEEKGGFLVYIWTLKEGRTVPAGQWVFAGQYQHERGGRDAKDDSYTITGAAGGRSYTVTGDFAAHAGSNGGS
ncbi:hypothetical protein AV521_29650 [Streptomyces sp. IMTB 2501]|uniref:hypothetical protein n=1 Tax=Streptomyces sp. IMTB 2501 TaxID=1776340 RepID=UPI00096FC7D8|nr:hypothetical protein [Streptomyces sp. IMTB 2501]OLZ65949.1 hypothetical protein AV521_29650 [Streptomyces sp. IMTB 2501]